MGKLTIVITFYQRHVLLIETLHTFERYDPETFNVVVVDDDSPDDIVLPPLPFDVTIVKLRDKTWNNTCTVHNVGFHEALKSNPDIIVIQNAECYHWGDVLGYARENLTDENYIAFPAYSLAEGETPCNEVIKDKCAEFNGDSGWYNHATHRPLALHFCTAITTANLKKLNGFDERMKDGIAYEDNVFVHQIKNLGLRIDIPDRPMVFHPWHYSQGIHPQELVEMNQALWLEIEQEKTYKAIHLITPDL
jgi:glycosyltransferase involved in cell wall biosynthesis